MATGWFRGVVKEVPNGDSLVIMGNVASGPPPEKRITLASLVAPRLGRRDGSTSDEHFAWQSKEFLRKLTIGQDVTFKTDYTLPQAPNMEFGSVFLTTKNEMVAGTVVAAGWAKLRSGGGQQSPYYDALLELQNTAESQKLGLWAQDQEALDGAVRKQPANTNEYGSISAQHVLDTAGKGKPLPAIVDRVGNMATVLNVTLLPDLCPAAVLLAGVQAPSLNRRPAPTAEDPEPEPLPEPFSREAKHFTEIRILNREVRVVLEGIDKHDNLIGSLKYERKDGELADLGVDLVTAGLAKTAEWGLNMLTPGASFTLREAERKAKRNRVNMWRTYSPPADAPAKLKGHFSGTVSEIVSGDTIVVTDSAGGQQRRVSLSSIRTPKIGRRDDPRSAEPYAREAREDLRQRLIGQKVEVALEYDRKTGGSLVPGAPPSSSDAPERTMSFGTVTYTPAGAKTSVNVAEILLSRGLGTVVQHRSDDERSAHYETLLIAEEKGRKEKKGMHSSKEPAIQRINDLTLPGSANKAKSLLPSFQRMGKVSGVVDFVLSGHKLKVFLPKESVVVAFCPSGVRTPQRPSPTGRDGRPVAAEPYGQEAFEFTRQLTMQRNVEMEVETVDRGGTFLGRLRVQTAGKSVDVATALLSAGLAKLHSSFRPDEQPGGMELQAVQQKAMDARLKVWESYDPEAEAAANGKEDVGTCSAGETLSLTVTEVVDGGHFWGQESGNPRVSWLTQQLASSSISGGSKPMLRKGQLCLAKFSGDGEWYRASVIAANTRDPTRPSYQVKFVDWGNGETVAGSNVRDIEPALAALPEQAKLYALAYLKVPGSEDEFGDAAGTHLAKATGNGGVFSATVVSRGRNDEGTAETRVILHPKASEASSGNSANGDDASLNEELLLAGLARLQHMKRHEVDAAGKVIQRLVDAQEKAFKSRTGLWRYGDPGSDSDDDTAFASRGRR